MGIDKVLKELTAGYNITRSLENLSKAAPEKLWEQEHDWSGVKRKLGDRDGRQQIQTFYFLKMTKSKYILC